MATLKDVLAAMLLVSIRKLKAESADPDSVDEAD